MILETFKSIFNQLYVFIIQFLPNSPLRPLLDGFANIPYLKYLNWFFPVTECLSVMSAWLAVVAVYYMYQAIMRYIHLIG